MIVLDAGPMIALLDPADGLHDAATAFLEEHEQPEWGMSALTVAECLVRPTETGTTVGLRLAMTRLGLLVLDVTASDVEAIAQLRAATGLRMPDAVVLHTAERTGAELATTDRRLANAAGGRGVATHLIS